MLTRKICQNDPFWPAAINLTNLKNPPTYLGGLIVFWRWVRYFNSYTIFSKLFAHQKWFWTFQPGFRGWNRSFKAIPSRENFAKSQKMPSGQKCPKNDAIVKRGLNLNLKLKINFCLDFRSCEKVSSRVLDHFLFQHIEFNNL